MSHKSWEKTALCQGARIDLPIQVRGSHNSRPEQRLDSPAKGLVLLELIEEHQLIQQNSTQHDQLSPLQTADGNLTTPLEYVLEQAIERFNRLVPQHMKDATHVNTGIGVRVGAATGCDQPMAATFTVPIQIWNFVVVIPKHVPNLGMLASSLKSESQMGGRTRAVSGSMKPC